MKKPTFQVWAERLAKISELNGTCACTQTGSNMNSRTDLRPLEIEHWGPHDGGWQVAGFRERRWLYVTCPKCKHQYSFASLGLPKDEARYKENSFAPLAQGTKMGEGLTLTDELTTGTPPEMLNNFFSDLEAIGKKAAETVDKSILNNLLK